MIRGNRAEPFAPPTTAGRADCLPPARRTAGMHDCATRGDRPALDCLHQRWRPSSRSITDVVERSDLQPFSGGMINGQSKRDLVAAVAGNAFCAADHVRSRRDCVEQSDVDLPGDLEGVIDLDVEVPRGDSDLRMRSIKERTSLWRQHQRKSEIKAVGIPCTRMLLIVYFGN